MSDVANLISAWTAATPTQDFALEGLVTSGVKGQASTSTVTVTELNGIKTAHTTGANRPWAAILIPITL